jgi:hypothetical protein
MVREYRPQEYAPRLHLRCLIEHEFTLRSASPGTVWLSFAWCVRA